MVDDAIKLQALKGLVVVGLRIHHGKARVLAGLVRLPGLCRDVQIADHGQIVRPGYLVDARNIHAVHVVNQNALERQRRGQSVRIGIDEDAPVVVLVQALPPLLHVGDKFGIACHDMSL